MYEYLINNKTVIFDNETDMLAGLKAAEKAGYSIELVRDDSMSKKADDNFMTEKTPEEQLRATQLEASGGVAGTSEVSQEDFTQDPAGSADVVSETPAQQDTELPQVDTSLDSLLSNIPEVEEPPVLEEKEKEIPKFELEKKSVILLEGPLGWIDPPKIGSYGGKFGRRAVKEGEELRAFKATTDAILNSNTIYQLGIDGHSVSQLMENNVQPELRAHIVDVYSKNNPNYKSII